MMRIATLCIAAAVLTATPAPAQVLSSEAAVNKAGRQRMLSQRIVKAYCQIGLDIAPEASRTQLRQALSLFESQLQDLVAHAPDPTLKGALEELDREWRPFKSVALGPVDREGARRLHGLDETLLEAADRVTRLFETTASPALGRLVNVAGRQRMLSQRLAKLYMLRRWNIESARIEADAAAARAEFSAALETLRSAPQNTSAIEKEISVITLQWEWFQAALELDGAYSYALVVADASESILESTDRLTRMYEGLQPRGR